MVVVAVKERMLSDSNAPTFSFPFADLGKRNGNGIETAWNRF
jgi:hypothetical protein